LNIISKFSNDKKRLIVKGTVYQSMKNACFDTFSNVLERNGLALLAHWLVHEQFKIAQCFEAPNLGNQTPLTAMQIPLSRKNVCH
jgi:hypothetical protein